jgi:hypothetical protein
MAVARQSLQYSWSQQCKNKEMVFAAWFEWHNNNEWCFLLVKSGKVYCTDEAQCSLRIQKPIFHANIYV